MQVLVRYSAIILAIANFIELWLSGKQTKTQVEDKTDRLLLVKMEECMALGSPEEWERSIGEQVRALRIQRNLKQDELAARANVSKSALFQLENGKGSTLRTLVSVLNALGETAWLDNLAPAARVSPIQMLELGTQRRRVRRRSAGM